jgi:hypothetical protein
MWIENENDAVNQRFYTGASPDFIGQAYNWSGVAQASDGTWVTMISPQYFVSANHYHPGAGQTVTFYAGNSTSSPSYTGTVASFSAVPSFSGQACDLYLGELTAPIPSSADITDYPVLDLPSWSSYVGLYALVYGNQNLVGATTISAVGIGLGSAPGVGGDAYSPQMVYDYIPTGAGSVPYEVYLQGGDSGGPTFAIYDGHLDVLGTHWYNSDTTGENPPPTPGVSFSGDSFIPASISWLETETDGQVAVDSSGQGAVPEPATLSLLGLGLSGLAAKLARRKSR